MTPFDQPWLPVNENWRAELKRVPELPAGEAWGELVRLANFSMDFLATNRLDSVLQKHFGGEPPAGLPFKSLRLAVLSSSTTAQLASGIRVAALRRGVWATIYEVDYGQYLQELMDESSALHAFKPNAILVALDSRHLLGGANAAADQEQGRAILEEALGRVGECWRLAKKAFKCPIFQQTLMPVFQPVLGSNEHRVAGSGASLVEAANAELRKRADAGGVDILAIDAHVARDGLRAWHDPVFWHRAKQEVNPVAAPMYGELVVRLFSAGIGRSAKCLVLDLDNTLWGGVIGDDGLEGIVLGQGSAQGEAFAEFQSYARELARRGVILAVCSKNDEANALAAFERHPEMVLKRGDISCFVANWSDKATNLRSIAKQLNIGLDSLVFVDDNPFERNLVRQELPMVAVPEVPEDPSLIPGCLADAGYFEGLAVTEEDRARTGQYQSNLAREALREQATDLDSYLRNLNMTLLWRPFDDVGLQRIVQLINKTNQFNLMTRRYSENDVLAVMGNDRQFGLQLRLTDRFGDNGIIAIIIGKLSEQEPDALLIDTWLMSCRVLGRNVEEATLNVLAQEARRLGARKLIGEYQPTAKNGMVKDHYARLGFISVEGGPPGGRRSELDLNQFKPSPIYITIQGATNRD